MEPFIYTECVNCPEICINALKSYNDFHSLPVYVYLTAGDLVFFKSHMEDISYTNIQFVIVDDSMIQTYNKSGHLGTAILWHNVIANNSDRKIIHFDSDVIFKGPIIDTIIKELEDFDLVGGRRCYKHNGNNRDDIRDLSDTVTTYCFGFNAAKISKMVINMPNISINMIRGFFNPIGHPILDFFDPIVFDMYKNGASVKFIDNKEIGGVDENGFRDNSYVMNRVFDAGSQIIHFSSVGSGLNFSKASENGVRINVPEGYVSHALNTLNIYKYVLFGKTYDDIPEHIIQARNHFREVFKTDFIEF